MLSIFTQLVQASGSLFSIPVAFAQKASDSNNSDIAGETGNQIGTLLTSIINQIPLWITAIIVILFSLVLARIVKSSVENRMTVEGFEEEHKEIQIVAGRTANAAVIIIGITVGLKIAGIDLTAIIAAGAFGVGFALQDLIMNFIAGVMILGARHYTIGDIIKVDGTTGKIVEIQTRATILRAFNGTKIVVPNATLFKNQVTSFTSNPFRRIQLINGVAYGSDLKKVMDITLEAIKSTKGVVLEPKPSVWLYEWGDYSINFKINAWVDSKSAWVKTKNRLMVNIDNAFNANHIEIPYPIQTIYVGKEEDEETNQQVDELNKETPKSESITTQAVEVPLVVESQPPQIPQIFPTPPAFSPIPVIPPTETVPPYSVPQPENIQSVPQNPPPVV